VGLYERNLPDLNITSRPNEAGKRVHSISRRFRDRSEPKRVGNPRVRFARVRRKSSTSQALVPIGARKRARSSMHTNKKDHNKRMLRRETP